MKESLEKREFTVEQAKIIDNLSFFYCLKKGF